MALVVTEAIVIQCEGNLDELRMHCSTIGVTTPSGQNMVSSHKNWQPDAATAISLTRCLHPVPRKKVAASRRVMFGRLLCGSV